MIEINDEDWVLPYSTAEKDGLTKKVQITVLIKKTAYDAQMNPYYGLFIQKLEITISDKVEEFLPLFMSVVSFSWGYGKQRRYRQAIIFHNLKEGSTQRVYINKPDLAFIHGKLRKIGKEVKITKDIALGLLKSGKIFQVVSNSIPDTTKRIQV